MNGVDTCRLIVDPPAPGSWNMAVDEALLEAAVDGTATLRLYQWAEPTLSLGYFQRLDDRRLHPASRACAVVRRQTGGGAILHDRELTYSLALPARSRFARDATELYLVVHEAIGKLLAGALESTATNWRLEIHERPSRLAPAAEPFLCFERRARGDLLLVADRRVTRTDAPPPAYKILGSAQRRHRGAILQHGSLLLGQSPAAPELPGWRELTGEATTAADLITALPEHLAAVLSSRLESGDLPSAMRAAAGQLERQKYASPAWTARR